MEQLQASKALALAQTESAKASQLSTYAEMIRKWVPALSLSYGLIVAFMYFFGEINFFPAGVNVGDALLLLFLAFGYGVLSFFFVGHGLMLMTPASVFRENLKSRDQPKLTKWLLLLYCAPGPFIPLAIAGLLKIFEFYMPEVAKDIAEPAILIVFLLLFLMAFFTLAIARSSAQRINGNSAAIFWKFDALIDLSLQSLMYWLAQIGVIIATMFLNSTGAMYVLFASMVGFIFVIAIERMEDKTSPEQKGNDISPQRKAIVLAVLSGFAAFFPMLWDSSQGNRGIAKAVFEQLGLRTTGATLYVSSKALTILTENAKISDANLNVCLIPDGTAIVAPIDVLWHGMGKTSLVEITGKNASKIELPSGDIQLVRNQKSRCHELTQSIHFVSGGREPIQKLELAGMKAELTKTLSNLPAPSQIAPGWGLEKIVVSGNTDPLPFGESGNEFLAQQRAEKVIAELKLLQELKERATPDVFQAVANGSRVPQGQCSAVGGQKQLSECHSINRRVTVRLIFRPIGKSEQNKK